MGFSQNAIMAKSRALYGKRLKKQDYDNLINSGSVNEIVLYLKNETAYGETFQSANSDMSTVRVEELLKIHILKSFEKVSRYENSSGVQFYKYILMKNDIQQILRFVQFLMINKPEEYLNVLPPFFNKQSELDLYALAACRNFDDLLSALQGTVYQKVLKPFELSYKDPHSYMRIECALDEKLWEVEKEIIEKHKGKEKKNIKEVISYRNDMENLIRIYRLKRLANEDVATIRRFLNLGCTNFTEKDINMMLDAPTAHEAVQMAAQTYYKKHFLNHSFDSPESFTRGILYEKFHKAIRYSTDPVVVMLSYFYLAENEVNNIIHIVEGVRYGMTPADIGALPIGTEC